MRLYHYTCDHSAARIRTARWLVPHRQVVLSGRELVWLTDLEEPNRAALGLTSHILRCDRTKVRVVAVTSDATHWPAFARGLPAEQRHELECAPGVLPMHWYVAEMPVPVLEVSS
jgi:hypothetical protein